MPSMPNKITITVNPARYTETVTLRAAGRYGKTSLVIPVHREGSRALTPAPDAKTYWAAILATAQEIVQAL